MSCALCVDEREVGKLEERYRIIKLLDEFIENSDLPEVVDRLEWLKGSIKGETE
jgi:hypothetical protein